MGFTYLGPIDGHDLNRLCDVLQWAKELCCPVVVHVNTIKGKGYPFAEKDPGKFHGVAPFDPQTGILKKPGGESFSSVFGNALAACAAKDGGCAPLPPPWRTARDLPGSPGSSRSGSLT